MTCASGIFFRTCSAAARDVPKVPLSISSTVSRSTAEGDPAHWRIEDGTILGEISKGQSLNKNTWLVCRGGELSDFELNVQFKLTGLPAANSGIQIRCRVENVDHVSGYQADLDMGAAWLGRIYDEHAASAAGRTR